MGLAKAKASTSKGKASKPKAKSSKTTKKVKEQRSYKRMLRENLGADWKGPLLYGVPITQRDWKPWMTKDYAALSSHEKAQVTSLRRKHGYDRIPIGISPPSSRPACPDHSDRTRVHAKTAASANNSSKVTSPPFLTSNAQREQTDSMQLNSSFGSSITESMNSQQNAAFPGFDSSLFSSLPTNINSFSHSLPVIKPELMGFASSENGTTVRAHHELRKALEIGGRTFKDRHGETFMVFGNSAKYLTGSSKGILLKVEEDRDLKTFFLVLDSELIDILACEKIN